MICNLSIAETIILPELEQVGRLGFSTARTEDKVPLSCGLRGTPGQARALSIIFSQMPLDLRMSSTSSRAAPLPPFALVM